MLANLAKIYPNYAPTRNWVMGSHPSTRRDELGVGDGAGAVHVDLLEQVLDLGRVLLVCGGAGRHHGVGELLHGDDAGLVAVDGDERFPQLLDLFGGEANICNGVVWWEEDRISRSNIANKWQ